MEPFRLMVVWMVVEANYGMASSEGRVLWQMLDRIEPAREERVMPVQNTVRAVGPGQCRCLLSMVMVLQDLGGPWGSADPGAGDALG